MKKILLLSVLICCSLLSFAQNFQGKVTDEAGMPIPYANIILQHAADSSFVTGTISNEEGKFSLQAEATGKDLLLKVSFIGYLTQTQTIKANGGFNGEIRLKGETQTLGEVVVKGHQPVYSMKHGTLTTQVQNSVLKEFGTASDVLKQLPLVTNNGEALEVMGRGTPAIYINNRLMRDENELEQLKSEDIKNVQVIMNPGNRYSAEVRAVIKITTLKRSDEGMGANLSLEGSQRKNFNHNEQLDLIYRKNKLEIFGTAHWEQAKAEERQHEVTTFTHNDQPYRGEENRNSLMGRKRMNFSGGFNYDITDKQSVGVKYTYTRGLPFDFKSEGEGSFLQGDKESEFINHQNLRNSNYSHYANAYYQNKFERASIYADGTFMRNAKSNNNSVHESVDGTENIVPTKSEYLSDLYALKAWSEFNVGKGMLEVGVEGTQTSTDQDYKMLNEDIAEELPSTLSQSDQLALAVFGNYSRSWNNFSLSAGLRYEYVNYDYKENGVKQEGQSKTFNNLSPTLSLNYNKGGFNAALSYRTMLYRPDYYMLRSDVAYNNIYSYESGNPTLKHNTTYWTNLMLGYKDFQASFSYYYQKNGIMSCIEMYKDLPVTLFSTMNQDQSYVEASFSYSPTIGRWKPVISGSILKGYMPHYGQAYFESPLFTYAWKNTFTFPHAWILNISLSGNASGGGGWARRSPNFCSDFFVKKTFGKTVEVYVGANDIFNTYREKWRGMINNITLDRWNSTDYRSVYAKVVIKMNNFRNTKYKGGSSGAAERMRM